MIVANTIPLRPEVAENTTKIRALSVGALLAEVSVSSEVMHQSCCHLDLEVNPNGNARSNAVVAAICCDAMQCSVVIASSLRPSGGCTLVSLCLR